MGAIAIALAGVVDPALTTTRTIRPEISVVAVESSTDATLAARVAEELGERFTVIPAPFAAGAATVLVGTRLPAPPRELANPVFAVVPAPDGPMATIESVHAPSHSALDARVRIVAGVRAVGAPGDSVETTLRMHEVIVDRDVRPVSSAGERQDVSLSLVPSAPGAVQARVATSILGAMREEPNGKAAADLLIDVRDARWSVLFHDPRPSWNSTFVRRAVEGDPRFVVTSRVVTSRNVSTDAGRPGALDDLAAVSLFDAIAIGAPDALSAREVAGIEAYLRRRGGSVILLLDQRAAGAYDRLTGVRSWTTASGSGGFTVRPVTGDSIGLRASSLAWPAVLPTSASPLAFGHAATGDDSTSKPVLWRIGVGAGELVVSGALDAWRYRDPAVSGFDGFWRMAIADAAASSPPPISIAPASTPLTPGERTQVTITVRDASLSNPSAAQPVRATVSASLETPTGPVNIHLWPDGTMGRFRGAFRAPNTPGIHRLVATSDGARAEAPLLVLPTVSRAAPNDSDLLSVWAGAHGGRAMSAAALPDLAGLLEESLVPASRRQTWYPMRSAWWILPFALLLGAEWLWRRRHGLA